MNEKQESWERYVLPLHPAPEAVLDASAAGVRPAPFLGSGEAGHVLGLADPPANGAYRDSRGRVLVTCVTDMPGVTPAMVDWWFGWHLPSSERYRLWHPTAHVRATVKEDRSHVADDRARYIGNVSHVDEYIGLALKKLSIAFVPPETFGLRRLDEQGATAVCAFTSDRVTRGQGGCLVHYVVPTPDGAQMRSGFWLGEITHHIRLVDRVMHGVLNSRLARRLLVSDRMAIDLLLHCSEEMNHLARFLPRLHADMHAGDRRIRA